MVSVSALAWPERATSLSTEMGTEMVGRGSGLDTGEPLLELPSEVAATCYFQVHILSLIYTKYYSIISICLGISSSI